MAKRPADVAAELARLTDLTIFEIRSEWRHLHRMYPPMRLSRDLLIRGITYKLQERVLGGLSKSMQRKLDADVRNGVQGQQSAPPLAFKSGTRLVREWHGVTHIVLVHADGFEWCGQRYRSLSLIARKITGAHWSGPRFFGLKRRVMAITDEGVRADHGQS